MAEVRVRTLSWFAGVGGFDAALLAAGHEIIGACEIDEAARKVYVARFGEPRWFARDIRDVRPEEIPDADLWVGGPPCQSFSVAGKRGGMGDARGNLFLHFLALAAVRKPPVLLIENVPGLLSSGGGRDFGTILAALVAQGRRVAWVTLDARYFGVAQRRRRIFICASLSGDPRAMLFDAGTEPPSSGAPVALVRGDTWYAPQEALFAREGEAPFAGAAWPGSGYAAGDRCWVRDVPEWREPVERASLAATLEAGPIPARFFLSARAYAGILRRADRRGRALPAALDAALRATAGVGSPGSCSRCCGSIGGRGPLCQACAFDGPAPSAESLAFGANRTSGPREEAGALSAHGGASGRLDFETETFVVGPIRAQGAGGRGHRVDAEAAATGHLIADGDRVAALRAGQRSGPDDNDAQAGRLVFAVRGTAQGGAPAEERDESMALQGKGCKPTGNEAGTVVFDTAPTLRAADGHHGRSSPRGDGCDALVVAGQCHGSNVGGLGELRRGNGGVTGGVPFVALAVEAPGRKMSGGAKVGDGLDADPRVQGVLAFESRVARNGRGAASACVPSLKARSGADGRGDGAPLVAFTVHSETSQGDLRGAHPTDEATCLSGARGGFESAQGGTVAVPSPGRIRRLTPTETERLQAFIDGWTCVCGAHARRVQCRKPEDLRAPPRWPADLLPRGCGHAACGCKCADGRRYIQMGNAVCVSVVRWIAGRLDP